jgi:hypothetical protein
LRNVFSRFIFLNQFIDRGKCLSLEVVQSSNDEKEHNITTIQNYKWHHYFYNSILNFNKSINSTDNANKKKYGINKIQFSFILVEDASCNRLSKNY